MTGQATKRSGLLVVTLIACGVALVATAFLAREYVTGQPVFPVAASPAPTVVNPSGGTAQQRRDQLTDPGLPPSLDVPALPSDDPRFPPDWPGDELPQVYGPNVLVGDYANPGAADTLTLDSPGVTRAVGRVTGSDYFGYDALGLRLYGSAYDAAKNVVARCVTVVGDLRNGETKPFSCRFPVAPDQISSVFFWSVSRYPA